MAFPMALGFDTIMDVANLPAVQDSNPPLSADERFEEAIADQIGRGVRPAEIARKIYPHDPVQRKRLRARIRHMVYHNPSFAQRVAIRAHGELLIGLVPTVAGLARQGSRGRADAGKLVLEASGFHNPRVQHQHSGEIKIKLDMPRPKYVDSTAVDDVEEVTGS